MSELEDYLNTVVYAHNKVNAHVHDLEARVSALEELIVEKPEAESEPEKPTAPICPTCGGEMRELKWEYYANNTSLWGKNIEMGWACPICNKKAIEDNSEGFFL